MSSYGPQALQKARVRDERWLVVTRRLAPKMNDTGSFSVCVPTWLVEALGYERVRFSYEQEGDEVHLVLDDDGVLAFTKAGKPGRRHVYISAPRLGGSTPFHDQQDVVVEFDLREPENGVWIYDAEGIRAGNNIKPRFVRQYINGER